MGYLRRSEPQGLSALSSSSRQHAGPFLIAAPCRKRGSIDCEDFPHGLRMRCRTSKMSHAGADNPARPHAAETFAKGQAPSVGSGDWFGSPFSSIPKKQTERDILTSAFQQRLQERRGLMSHWIGVSATSFRIGFEYLWWSGIALWHTLKASAIFGFRYLCLSVFRTRLEYNFASGGISAFLPNVRDEPRPLQR